MLNVAQAQTDSTARISKHALSHLIGEHHRYKECSDKVKDLLAAGVESKNRETLYIKTIENQKKDSLQAATLLRIAKDDSDSWKESYEIEKREGNKRTNKWKGITAITVTLFVISLFAR